MRALAGALLAVLMVTGVASAQEAGGCAPVGVGDGTGVFFLVLSERCTADLAAGYDVIADLQRDDQPQELLVLVAGGSGQETRLVAQVLVNEVRAGSVDGHTWHAVTEEAPEPSPAEPEPEG